MKNLILFLITLSCICMAAESSRSKEQAATEEEVMLFRDRLKEAEVKGDASALVNEAFEQGDIGLMMECFREPRTAGFFLEKVAKLASSRLKERLIVAMLRSPWSSDEESSQRGSRPIPLAAYICIDVVSPLVPEEGLVRGDAASANRLLSMKYREELARKFENTIHRDQGKADVLPKADERQSEPAQGGAVARRTERIGIFAKVAVGLVLAGAIGIPLWKRFGTHQQR